MKRGGALWLNIQMHVMKSANLALSDLHWPRVPTAVNAILTRMRVWIENEILFNINDLR